MKYKLCVERHVDGQRDGASWVSMEYWNKRVYISLISALSGQPRTTNTRDRAAYHVERTQSNEPDADKCKIVEHDIYKLCF